MGHVYESTKRAYFDGKNWTLLSIRSDVASRTQPQSHGGAWQRFPFVAACRASPHLERDRAADHPLDVNESNLDTVWTGNLSGCPSHPRVSGTERAEGRLDGGVGAAQSVTAIQFRYRVFARK